VYFTNKYKEKNVIMATKKHNSILAPLIEMAKAAEQITLQAVGIYSAEVENIIESNTKNQQTIERCLDGMLDFCGDKKMLLLYKKLCRYYVAINPSAVVDYINIYRELWDSEDEQMDNKKKKIDK
jgi:hypothetical protein